MWFEITGIFLMTVAFLYWQSSQKIKEIAWRATKRHCDELELQMLDGYIALIKLTLGKNAAGNWQWVRRYQFEFSATGGDRYRGMITMHARQIDSIQLDPYRIQ
ncbi:MAG: DUF3301 domain-containing protein [Methyloprofundus sp.]|nr:DUF3301 domain-containing protein [Methyloprofundus sp.]